jgi:nicotinamide riboside kinase
MNTVIVNLFGEPSAGKSTVALEVTARLKKKGIKAEYVSEFAKDKVWENNAEVFNCQEYIFGKQSFKIKRLIGKVDVIITDSPLFLSIVYNEDPVLGEAFNKTVFNVFNHYRSLNFLLTRTHKFEAEGRIHDEKQSEEIRRKLVDALGTYGVWYSSLDSKDAAVYIERLVKYELFGNKYPVDDGMSGIYFVDNGEIGVNMNDVVPPFTDFTKDRAFKNLMCEVYDVFMNKQKEIYKEGKEE